MLTIDVAKVRSAQEARKQAPQPKYIITIAGSAVPSKSTDLDPVANKEPQALKPASSLGSSKQKETLSAKAWREFNEMKVERSQRSNEIWNLVEAGATKADLKEHYAKIKSYQPALQELFRIARHVDQYGVLPEQKKEAVPLSDLFSLKDQKRKLIDQRCKLQQKIKAGKAKNPKRISEWQLQLDEADLEYKSVCHQIAKLEGKA